MRAMVIAAALAAFVASAGAQDERRGWFPFLVPDLASAETRDSAIDLSHLNPQPAGTHGFLRADGEDLVDDRGVPVRLFGSNITDYHAMPPKDVAPAVAERLKQFGINFIRLHYFDWAAAPAGILNDDLQTLNPEKLDQFDFLIAELKRRGIYVDINLHVARGYPGMPEGWNHMGKGLDIIHEPYIDSQKHYARDLLTHVNPYTGNAYVDEPAVAVIELNNENTALRDWEQYAGLSETFTIPLRAKWNRWILDRYGSRAGLEAVWNANSPTGPELLRNAGLDGLDQWELQNAGEGESELNVVEDGDRRFLRWRVERCGTQGWHTQFYQRSVPVEQGNEYVVTFRARADGPGALSVSLMPQQEPWGFVGAPVRLSVGSEWADYGVVWEIDNPQDYPLRLNIDCTQIPATYDIADLSLREGGADGLRAGEAPEDGTVPLVADTASRKRAADYLQFLADLELQYATEMTRYIREELGAKSLLMDTQVSYGGLAGLARETAVSDIVDCHSYPAHPQRERDDRGQYWSIRNVSMVDEAFGGLESLALRRAAGKPYLVTEFDLNPPNDHAAETFPLLALMAAWQDWAGVADYAWYNFQKSYGHERISSHFATTGHAGQMAFVPTAALLFRRGLVEPAARRQTLSIPADHVARSLVESRWGGIVRAWENQAVALIQPWIAQTAVELKAGLDKPQSRLDGSYDLVTPGTKPKDPVAMSGHGPGMGHMPPVLTVNAPSVRMLIGRVCGQMPYRLGDVEVRPMAGMPNGYANIALVALDERPIAESQKLLLTAVARVENRGQTWNADRTSVGHDWGEGPTLAEPVLLDVTLPATGWHASALDGSGQRRAPVPMDGPTLEARPEHKTLWYLIER